MVVKKETVVKSWGCGFVAYLPTIREAGSSVPNSVKEKQKACNKFATIHFV